MDRDYFSELFAGMDARRESILVLGDREISRERFNHILLEAGRRALGMDE